MPPFKPWEQKRHGTVAEKRLANRLKAKLTPGSGAAHRGAKADMSDGTYRTEAKSTVKGSFSIKYETLCKVSQEAVEQGEVPVLGFQFVTPDGRERATGSWVCIPEARYRELIDDG